LAPEPWRAREFDGLCKDFEDRAIEFIPARQRLDGTAADGIPAAAYYKRPDPDEDGKSGVAPHELLQHCWQRAADEWSGAAGLKFDKLPTS
jgi:hypothetical protein